MKSLALKNINYKDVIGRAGHLQTLYRDIFAGRRKSSQLITCSWHTWFDRCQRG